MRRWQVWVFRPSVQITFWALVAVIAFLVSANAIRRAQWWVASQHREPVLVSPRDGSPSASPGPAVPPEGWTSVAKAAMPAVVNIATSKTPSRRGPLFNDPFFRFFGEPHMRPRREQSLGSGVIVSRDGYLLTNNHVVEGARDIRVTLADRRELEGTLVGADAKTDLAVVRLSSSGLSVVTLAERPAEVAEIVLAIGSPFGLAQTVTQGIVSAVGRANLGIADYEDFIQTDAAINPGNSGGALVNSRGELIGINTAIFSQSGGYSGIGFAVPITMARQVMDHVVKRGKVTRGYLGVSVQDLTTGVARGLGVAASRGVLIADVAPDSPAASAGLERGDVITAIDGKPVEDAGQFRNLVAATPPGTRVRLTLVRDGNKEQTADVAIGELTDRAQAAATPASARAAAEPLGVSDADLTPELMQRLALPRDTRGAVVVGVAPDGRAADAGLRPGDVIQEVNRQPVQAAKDFARAVQQAGNGDLVVLVNRNGSAAYIPIGRG